MVNERMDPVRAAPFELGHGQDAALLLHGFTGSPWDVRPLGEELASRGFFAKGLRLPGHAMSPEAMLEVTAQDWIDAAETALGKLDGYRQVYLAGLSMGALLSVALAARHPERIRAIALLAPAIRSKGMGATAVHALRFLPVEVLLPWVKKNATDIADAVLRAQAPVLSRFPLTRLRDLWTLQERALRLAAQVRAPSLIIVGGKDKVISAAGTRLLATTLRKAGAEVEEHTFEKSGHILPRDLDRQRVATLVADFFERHRDARSEPSTARAHGS